MDDTQYWFMFSAIWAQTAMLFWSAYVLFQNHRTLSKQAEVIDVLTEVIKRQHVVLALRKGGLDIIGNNWQQISLDDLPPDVRQHVRMSLVELLGDLRRKEN
jgi:hypothetical protein